MKTMKNFAAQQLSKKEMNNLKGGGRYDMECQFRDRNGIMRKIWGTGNSLGEVTNHLWAQTPSYVIRLENCVANF